MDFEWDETKRLKNIKKHALDFIDAVVLFSNPHLTGLAKTIDAEERQLATGMIEDVCVNAVFTMRGSTIRIISMRRARDAEKQRYQKIFSS
ncbi:BrnT family toxin [Methylocella silvestris]|uniref:BrnT family toxin n=1 Tax=Methylocella silvestris TaxID=199596 RepID=A0A2J7TEY7_METSI|nr:BrnT family toxin [Methylocella silvestris]PNG25319.1 hypothetical protein CR492_14305 [Methylocella silvestris]